MPNIIVTGKHQQNIWQIGREINECGRGGVNCES